MKTKYYLAPLAALLLAACVDNEFCLDQVSTEITVGGGTTTLPLGYLEQKSLGEIIEADDMEGLQIDPETGEYSLSVEGEEKQISIEGITTQFDVPETMTHFEAGYPAFDLIGSAYVIDESFEVSPMMAGGSIPSVTTSVVAGLTVSGEVDDKMTHAMHYEVPGEIANITKVWLTPTAAGDPGARINARFALNDLAVINGGGKLNMELIAPAGYELYDADHKHLADNTFRVEDYLLAEGEDEVEFHVFLASVENTNPISSTGEIDIPVELEYHLSFELTTKAASLTLNQIPELHIDSSLQYEDVEIVLNEVMLVDHERPTDGVMTIDGLPAEVKSIQKVTFAEHSPIRLVARDFDWLDDETAHLVYVEVLLPHYLTLHEERAVGYDAATHTLKCHLDDLRHGVEVYLDAIDFGEGGGVAPVEGEMLLEFAPEMLACIERGAVTTLSHLVHEGVISLSAGVEAATLELHSVEGVIDYRHEESTLLEIGGLEDEELDITINNPGLSPEILVDFSNPLTLESFISLELVPEHGGVADEQNTVTAGPIALPAATMEGGEVVSRVITLVLAEESRREEYADPKYTFVACDLAKLFVGSMPDKVQCRLVLSTDSSKPSTLYAAEEFTASYAYRVDIPFTFSSDLDLRYEQVVDDLGDTFSDLADREIKVGDVALIAEVGTTIPLDFTLEAELVDAEGNPTEAQLRFPAAGSTLKGSADGKKESLSQLRLELDLGEGGRVANLAEVAGVRLALRASCSATESASLRTDQYIYLKLKIELDGAITIDLGDLSEEDDDNDDNE